MRKKLIKYGVAILFSCTILFNFEILGYLWMQSKGQFKVLWYAEPVESMLNDKTLDSVLRSKIGVVQEVKRFAQDSLGLEIQNQYSTFYNQNGKQILWNLSASEPFALKSVEWYFPIVGKVSYKGFFDLDQAISEENDLKKNGFDTRIRPVNAWSTLGWFNDPILSNTLDRIEGSIAELFIHEITHSNIFIKDSLTFNENLASFIGEQGAMLYLTNKYGKKSKQYVEYVQQEKDMNIFIEYCLLGADRLRLLYDSFENSLSVTEKKRRKKEFMELWVLQIDSLNLNDNDKFVKNFEFDLPNNAFFLAFDRYSSKKSYFQYKMEHEFNDDLSQFINSYRSENN